MYGDSQIALNDYYHSIYLGRKLLATIGGKVFLAKSIKRNSDNKYEYFIIQRKGGRDTISRYTSEREVRETFCKLLSEVNSLVS